MPEILTVLDYLRKQLAGELPDGALTHMAYPTAITRLLGFRLVEIDEGFARLELEADAAIHGNQQRTVHGGMLCELADAAIGTAHSTCVREGESFTSIDLKVSFFRPVWKSLLSATAKQVQHGRTLSHYQCDILREDGKQVALAMSTVMTLRGDAAQGR